MKTIIHFLASCTMFAHTRNYCNFIYVCFVTIDSIQVVIGKGCIGRITRLVVWNSEISRDELTAANADINHSFTGTPTPVISTSDYYFSPGSCRVVPSILNDPVCDPGVENDQCMNTIG